MKYRIFALMLVLFVLAGTQPTWGPALQKALTFLANVIH
jgi:hypothetical protein